MAGCASRLAESWREGKPKPERREKRGQRHRGEAASAHECAGCAGLLSLSSPEAEWSCELPAGGFLITVCLMTSSKNPFPGMNPFLERRWPDVHTALIGYIRDALADGLPPDLNVRAEEGVVITAHDEEVAYRADVAVSESWKEGVAPSWRPEEAAGGAGLAQPLVLHLTEVTPRWIEIREATGKLVTVIEVLSPVNKSRDGLEEYRAKQRDYLASGINLVEIDLLRGGQHALAFPHSMLTGAAAQCPYFICVSRATRRGTRYVYPCPLRQRLPAIQIPLRPHDPDVVLDLQPLIDRCYEKGRHWQENFAAPLDPPLSAEDAAWVAERLRAAGLLS